MGIKKKNLGTASRPDGSFTLNLKEEYRHDTLTFSAIGYHELSLPISSILSGGLTAFELSEKTRRSGKLSSATRLLRSRNLALLRATLSCMVQLKQCTQKTFRSWANSSTSTIKHLRSYRPRYTCAASNATPLPSASTCIKTKQVCRVSV
ncbi:hypothetical protein [Pontibacter sp. BAB1700]|uniref:hypothetical protein n=1 Tax=Pontibacter sp. BAB1700 TaxID=1144253 RepID=UPI00350F19FD